MIRCVEKGITEPINLGSGEGITIKEIVEAIQNVVKKITGEVLNVQWDTTKPAGDAIRKMDTTRARSYGISPFNNLEDGIYDTANWYLKHKHDAPKRYDVFAK